MRLEAPPGRDKAGICHPNAKLGIELFTSPREGRRSHLASDVGGPWQWVGVVETGIEMPG